MFIYPKARLNKTDQEVLAEEFVDFGEMWNITTRLIKNSWKPFLWKVLIIKLITLGVILTGFLIVGASLFSGISDNLQLISNDSRYTLNELPELLSEFESGDSDAGDITVDTESLESFVEANGQQMIILVISLFILTGGGLLFNSLLNIRVVSQYTNSQEKAFLSFSRSTWISLIKIAAVSIVFGLLISILSNVFALLTSNSTILFILEQFLNFLFYSFLGLFTFYIILDRESMISSLTKSFRASNEVYWQNIIRWLIYQIVYIATFIVLVIGCLLLLTLLSLFGFSAGSMTSILLISVPVAGLYILGMLCIETFYTAFSTISYYNIRSITNK